MQVQPNPRACQQTAFKVQGNLGRPMAERAGVHPRTDGLAHQLACKAVLILQAANILAMFLTHI